MIIANPIYDVVFKRLLEHDKVAKFFIGTLLDTPIEALELLPQTFAPPGEFDFAKPADVARYEAQLRQRYTTWVLRLGFMVTLRTKTGEVKKVLVEVQKAKNQVDLMSFRHNLAEQYKRQAPPGDEKMVLPVTTIYVLGFPLPDIETPCLRVERNYKDLVNKELIKKKSDFVEKLSHDSYVVQVGRVTNRYHTKLDKLLSLFEQRHFTDETETVKEFKHRPENEDVKLAVELLHFAATDPAERKKIEAEREAWRTLNALFADKEEELLKQLAEKDKALAEKDRLIEELTKKLNG
ncbi:MAG: hypothetical protein MUC97_09430 [Bernardetiaceae bacterium]|nr:hypothetical protein [Bernardetiaceae bacterium]